MGMRKTFRAIILLFYVLMPFSNSGLAQQMQTIKGKVVDRDNKGIPGIKVHVIRGAESIPLSVSEDGADDKKGSYTLTFPSGGIIAIAYGSPDQYYLNIVSNISGRTNHELTKVLVKKEKNVALSDSDASEALNAYDHMLTNPAAYATELGEYSHMLKADDLPEKFRPRLKEFEVAVADLQKQKPNFVPNLFDSTGDSSGSTVAEFNGKKISVKYKRLNFRDIDWIGANQTGSTWQSQGGKRSKPENAPEFETTVDLVIDGKTLPSGKYSIFAEKTAGNNWALSFQPKSGTRGFPIFTGGVAALLSLNVDDVSDSTEKPVINLYENNGKANIKIQLGSKVFSGSIVIK